MYVMLKIDPKWEKKIVKNYRKFTEKLLEIRKKMQKIYQRLQNVEKKLGKIWKKNVEKYMKAELKCEKVIKLAKIQKKIVYNHWKLCGIEIEWKNC